MFALLGTSCCWLAQPGDFLKAHAVTSILFVGLIFSFGFGGLENAFGADEVACLTQEASGLGPAVLRFTVESESKIIARAFKSFGRMKANAVKMAVLVLRESSKTLSYGCKNEMDREDCEPCACLSETSYPRG